MGSMCVSLCRCCMFVFVVHPVAIMRATRPRTSALRMPSTHPAIRNANHR